MLTRPANVADAPAIAEIGRVAFPPTYADSLDSAVIDTVVAALYTDEAIATAVRAAAEEPRSRFLVVEHEGRIVGFLHYDETGAEPELHRIYLAPDAIGVGAGSALMNALNASLPPSAPYVLLVATANTRAIAFYERHGLAVREAVDSVDYYRRNMSVDIDSEAEPYPAFIMERRV